MILLTYNIWTYSKKFKQHAEVIIGSNADIVALQEVKRFKRFKQLLKDTNLKGTYNIIPKTWWQNWLSGWIIPYYGDALLWNEKVTGKPFIRKRILKTSKADKDYARSYIVAEFKDFCFVATHFALDNENNTMIANAILNDVIVQGCMIINKPVYIAGDFNGHVNQFINAGFQLCNDIRHATKFDGSMIDLIYKNDPQNYHKIIERGVATSFKSEWLAKDQHNKQEQKTKVSDHLPYYVKINLT
jgi:endonuclease/exonuclease/phosphatase family metal-dependent hydrolase